MGVWTLMEEVKIHREVVGDLIEARPSVVLALGSSIAHCAWRRATGELIPVSGVDVITEYEIVGRVDAVFHQRKINHWKQVCDRGRANRTATNVYTLGEITCGITQISTACCSCGRWGSLAKHL